MAPRERVAQHLTAEGYKSNAFAKDLSQSLAKVEARLYAIEEDRVSLVDAKEGRGVEILLTSGSWWHEQHVVSVK